MTAKNQPASKQDNQAAELESLRKQVADLEAEKQQLELAAAPSMQAAGDYASAGPAKYKFRVSGSTMRNKQQIKLPAAEIDAPDESEAIRRYCLAEFNGGRVERRNVPLEPSSYAFKAECLSEKRTKDVRKQYTEAGTPEQLIPAGAR